MNEVENSFRRAWRDMLAGRTYPINTLFDSDGESPDNGEMPTTRYTTKEAAAYLKVSVERILDLIEEKRFPGAVKINRRWEIPIEDLENFQYKPTGRPRKKSRRRGNTGTKTGT
jgi:excisionase family DNA binding protein